MDYEEEEEMAGYLSQMDQREKEEMEFYTDLAVQEMQRWIEVCYFIKSCSPAMFHETFFQRGGFMLLGLAMRRLYKSEASKQC